MRRRASDYEAIETTELRLLKIREVLTICGISKSSLYAAVREGTFPAPVKLTERSSAWVKSEVMEWIEGRMRAR
jgi:prophage regulatory protein